MSVNFLQSRRERVTAATVVVAIAFLGFWVGIRQRPASAEYKSYTDDEAPTEGYPARTNKELSVQPWSSELPKWGPTTAEVTAPVTTQNKEAYLAALEKRAARRAYEGAPPTIPHPVSQGGARECLICHGSSASIGEVSAPVISHKAYTVCTQCHVPEMGGLPQTGEEKTFAPMVESSFVGMREAPAPWKYTDGSPPQQPHKTFMRENCSSCHGAQGRPGLQSSHPERRSCQQCHAPSAQVDQHASSRPFGAL